MTYRPESAALTVDGTVTTGPAGSASTVTLSDDRRPECIGTPGCTATVSGEIPVDYVAPLTGINSFVGTFRIEEPDAYMRTAFIEALGRQGVAVTAPAVAANAADALSATVIPGDYPADTLVASYESRTVRPDGATGAQGQPQPGGQPEPEPVRTDPGRSTIQGALAAERQILIDKYGVDGDQFDFPTNGSGTPDSQAAPRALVQMLTAMSKTDVAEQYRAALPVMGVDGSLATAGVDLPGAGHVFAKPGTTVAPTADGQGLTAQGAEPGRLHRDEERPDRRLRADGQRRRPGHRGNPRRGRRGGLRGRGGDLQRHLRIPLTRGTVTRRQGDDPGP